MKPSERIAEIFQKKDSHTTADWCDAIEDFLDEQDFHLSILKEFKMSDVMMFMRLQNYILEETKAKWKENINKRSLEEVLALFPYLEHEQEWEQQYSWEYVTEQIKQLYNK